MQNHDHHSTNKIKPKQIILATKSNTATQKNYISTTG